MLGDGAPLPVTAETPARILRTVEKENSYGGRRLSSATISRGGVTVRGKGTLEVLDGGSLEIVTGDLILAAGIIKADMLKEHLHPLVYTAPKRYLTSLNGASSNKWGIEPALLRVTPPEWAEKAIIIQVCTEYLAVNDLENNPNFWAINAGYVQGNIGQLSRLERGSFGGTANGFVLGESIGIFITDIARDMKPLSLGYAHKIDSSTSASIALNQSWVHLNALIFWIK